MKEAIQQIVQAVELLSFEARHILFDDRFTLKLNQLTGFSHCLKAVIELAHLQEGLTHIEEILVGKLGLDI